MAYDEDLAERIRDALSEQDHPVREVKMFGGLTFMVNEKMTATANTNGNLMVRCDPARVDELLDREGAEWPQMRGRPMSKGWVVVDSSGTASEEDFEFWITEALAYNKKAKR
jgi:hypothetical protein